MGDERLLPPPVLWAQRKNLLYVKVQLEDCRNPTIKVEKDRIYFKGKGGTDKKEHEVTLEFFKEIKPEESKYSVRDRATEFVLIKAEEGFWKRLLKEDKKFHWLKVDFNKWKDEDDSEDEVEGTDFEEMMRKMGGMSESSDLNYDDAVGDSDDEELPDLE
ncbi:co-chaperone protein daf-41-like isoform X2 [Stegodyphus dumicola]|uniref:co-chaperone protein daf-41-like isoform X2 n=1 Tax=Stegodyphus dumicola TaxID=202533 RepID=UPI0015AC30E7|nr:co-chaperone protein daf-41-like isoform X2 [Stegodyphus dumicola]